MIFNKYEKIDLISLVINYTDKSEKTEAQLSLNLLYRDL